MTAISAHPLWLAYNFLLLNGWEAERAAHFAVSMEDIAVDVAANHIGKETLAILIMFVLSV